MGCRASRLRLVSERESSSSASPVTGYSSWPDHPSVTLVPFRVPSPTSRPEPSVPSTTCQGFVPLRGIPEEVHCSRGFQASLGSALELSRLLDGLLLLQLRGLVSSRNHAQGFLFGVFPDLQREHDSSPTAAPLPFRSFPSRASARVQFGIRRLRGFVPKIDRLPPVLVGPFRWFASRPSCLLQVFPSHAVSPITRAIRSRRSSGGCSLARIPTRLVHSVLPAWELARLSPDLRPARGSEPTERIRFGSSTTGTAAGHQMVAPCCTPRATARDLPARRAFAEKCAESRRAGGARARLVA